MILENKRIRLIINSQPYPFCFSSIRRPFLAAENVPASWIFLFVVHGYLFKMKNVLATTASWFTAISVVLCRLFSIHGNTGDLSFAIFIFSNFFSTQIGC